MLTKIQNPIIVEKEKQETTSTNREELRGVANTRVTSLCGTCKYREECVLTGDKEKVIQCEEFTLKEENVITHSYFENKETNINTQDNRFPREDEFIGLCRTCNQRFDCMYIEGSSGVWNCEMYE